jgi:hypothetical protein
LGITEQALRVVWEKGIKGLKSLRLCLDTLLFRPIHMG